MLVVPANGRVERLRSSSDLLIDCAVSCNISGSFHLLSSDVQGWLQSFVIHLENLIGWLGSFARFMRHVKSASPTVDNCTKLICVLQKLGESCFKEKISLAVILIFHMSFRSPDCFTIVHPERFQPTSLLRQKRSREGWCRTITFYPGCWILPNSR